MVHYRCDFMFLALDQLINLAAKWRYMYGDNAGTVPIVIRAIIGQGWGQGATHSQNLASVLAHFPGLNVVMPATPVDAKGVICAALVADGPTVILEHRALYETEGEVPEHWCEPMQAVRMRDVADVTVGCDLTIVATSSMVNEAVKAADFLALVDPGLSVDVINAVSIRPLNTLMILDSVRKSGHLIVADGSWEMCGFASEVAALAAERLPGTKIKRITWPNCPCPTSYALEKQFYPTADDIVAAARDMLRPGIPKGLIADEAFDRRPEFVGPY
jgi:acetoin:2,6-dichlorophenolindophenol oxidoreductase subunit beta